jgi:lipoyl(octanoyl) transferase
VNALARWLGRVEYEPTWRAMQRYTDARDASSADELWCLEHPPVFTLGMNADASHVLAAGSIPVVPIDRGGQVTYHGPGQLVVYPLVDLRRRRLGVRDLVTALETALVALLAEFAIDSAPRRDAPGVYVGGAKIASVGLRIRRGCSYHGLALNVAMDLAPFGRINPCGYPGLEVVDLARLGVVLSPEAVARRLVPHLARTLHLPPETEFAATAAEARAIA